MVQEKNEYEFLLAQKNELFLKEIELTNSKFLNSFEWNNFTNNILQLQDIRNMYMSYETDENKKRLKMLKEINEELKEEWFNITFFLWWSIVAGQSIQWSDIEMSLLLEDIEKYDVVLEKIKNKIKEKNWDDIEINTWWFPIDVLNLEKDIVFLEENKEKYFLEENKEKYFSNLAGILDFYFKYSISKITLWNKYNDLFSRINTLIHKNPKLWKIIEEEMKNRLDDMKVFFVNNSFKKYKERVINNFGTNSYEIQEFIKKVEKVEKLFYTDSERNIFHKKLIERL